MVKKSNVSNCLGVWMFLLSIAGLAQAATITVGPPRGGEFNFSTIQAGVNTAIDGDTVLVAPGEYVISEPITFRGKAITVKSEAGPDETTIKMATPADTNRGSVLIFENDETEASVLEGFMITDGKGSWVPSVSKYAGGGIYFNASSGTVKNCIFFGNTADPGGGGGVSACFGSSPILADCTFMENSATYGGGAHCWDNSSLTLTNCTLVENSAGEVGGGVYCCANNSSVTITDCTITGNSAINGGGIWTGINSSATVINCIIRGNSAIGSTPQVSGYGGGAECWNNSSMVMSDCTIKENTAGRDGGAVFCETSPLTMTNCKIVNNSAKYAGGGMECVKGPLTLTNCTIARNSAGEPGGAVLCWQGSTNITNSIVWANIAPQGREFSVVYGGALSLSYSNIANGQAGIHLQSGCTLNWGEGNIDVDPLFGDPDNGDYHLKSQASRWDYDSQAWIQDDVTSPCIDAGDPMSPIGWESFPNGGFVNMGAYGGTTEASKTYFGKPVCETIVAGDINGDGQVNMADLEIMALHWTDDEPLPLP
jgi:hypothetical protein